VRTLQLTVPFGRTVIIGVVLATVVFGAAEIVLRMPGVQDRLPAPSVGSNHMHFETKVHVFRALEESLDCYFLGSSVAHRGFDPAAFEAAYFAQTGQRLTCFNFGIVGGNETTGLLLAEMLTRESAPKLLVFGTVPRVISREVPSPVEAAPWLQYHLGNWSAAGWLAENSAVYGYGVLYARQIALNQMDLHDRFALEKRLQGHAGYEPNNRLIELPPTQDVLQILQYQTYRFDTLGADRLDRMMAFADLPDTEVVIVEMPEHPIVIEGYEGREAAYRGVVAQISARADAAGVLFLPTYDLDFWTDDRRWADFGHLNRFGAKVLSRWVGEQVGQALVRGDLVIAAE
jgi:hypothetical protein